MSVQTAKELNTLAKSREPADRERLLLAIVDLCADYGAAIQKPHVQELLGSLLIDLVSSAEQDIRMRLAEKLAVSDWPPAELIGELARDDIEIARPILAGSPLLHDVDLVRLLVETSIDHQIEIAQRPRIGSPVVETILGQAQPAVLTALAGNDTAEISPDTMGKLVEASRDLAAMRSPLVRHPRMTADLAEKLYAWVGQSLRMAIVSRFRVDAEALDRALAEAVGEARLQGGVGFHGAAAPLSAEQQDMERRLIGKLHQAGQLRTGYLVRSLREQRLSLFETALAALGDYDHATVRNALDAETPDALALACVGVGVDRSVFSTILELASTLNGGKPSADAARARRVFDTFGPDRPEMAAAAFRRLAEPETTSAA